MGGYSKQGYDVSLIMNGSETLEVLQAKKPTVMISFETLPQVSEMAFASSAVSPKLTPIKSSVSTGRCFVTAKILCFWL